MLRARIALIVVALLAAVAWRAEVEWHGWGGLVWIGYFHWAIPAGALLFAGWLYRFARARRPAALALVSLALAALAYVTLYDALLVIYTRWPIERGRWLLAGIQALAAIGLYPAALWLAARRCGAPVRGVACAVAFQLWVLAPAAAGLVLDLADHIGGSDWLHAIKSGVVIPLLLVALGLPLVWPEGRGGVAGSRES